MAAGPQFYAWFRDLGVNLFAYDYRGFGASDGNPSEAGVYADAAAAYRYLTDSLHVPPSRIVLFGHSLGTGVTIELARHVAAAGMIVEDAYTSVVDRGQEVFPLLPIRLIARSRFASIDKVGTLRLPKLFLHARNDRTIPIAHGRKAVRRGGRAQGVRRAERRARRCVHRRSHALLRCRSTRSFAA